MIPIDIECYVDITVKEKIDSLNRYYFKNPDFKEYELCLSFLEKLGEQHVLCVGDHQRI